MLRDPDTGSLDLWPGYRITIHVLRDPDTGSPYNVTQIQAHVDYVTRIQAH